MMMSPRAQDFTSVYQALNKHNLHRLKEIYHPDISFCDPLHSLSGIDELTQYFNKLYANVSNISFIISDCIESVDVVGLYWQMQFSHSSLKKGLPIIVEGHSRLTFEQDLVISHHDYFDTNTMLFDHFPVVGGLIRMLKSRATQ